MIRQYLANYWQHPYTLSEITRWMENNKNVYFDKTVGRSWINGEVYYQSLIFDNEEDLLVFRLKFSEACGDFVRTI